MTDNPDSCGPPTPQFIELEKIYTATRAVEQGTETEADLRFLQGKGTSLGGLRPKCTVLDTDGTLAVGKFPSVTDTRSVVRGEVLALKLAAHAKLDGAQARVETIDGTPVAIIRRFDRTAAGARIAYLSGGSLLQARREHCPERFFEGFIAEQNMIGTALGLAVSGKIPYAATFACFLTRAYDFIRMAQYSRPRHLILCGSHCGASIGEDGPSQMGLEDIAMFRALIESTILYPADAVSAEQLTREALKANGIVYIRATRPKTPVIYENEEAFALGGSKVLRRSDYDRLTIVGTGITVHEALTAYESLKRNGITVRVIDAYSVRPLDAETLSTAARETGALIVVEDHALGGGLGDAVGAAIGSLAPVYRLAVTRIPRSGTGEGLIGCCFAWTNDSSGTGGHGE